MLVSVVLQASAPRSRVAVAVFDNTGESMQASHVKLMLGASASQTQAGVQAVIQNLPVNSLDKDVRQSQMITTLLFFKMVPKIRI